MASLWSAFRVAPGAEASTGAGPFTVYEPTSTAAPASRKTNDKTSAHAAARHLLAQIEQLHRAEFMPAERLFVPAPELPEFPEFLVTAEKQALRGIGRFDRAARRSVKERARRRAQEWAAEMLARASRERETEQTLLDTRWTALLDNEPAIVMATLSHAYADTQAPARLVSVVGSVGFVQVQGPSEVDVPVVKPSQTTSRAPTVVNLNQTERAQWHRLIVAARVLLAAKQTLAVAPGLTELRLLVMRPGVPEQPLLAVTIGRERLASADFSQRAGQVLDLVAEDVIVAIRGGRGEMQPIRVAANSAYGRFVR